MDDELRELMTRSVQLGIVTDVDNTKRMARVKFPDTDITSGWLYVVQNQPFIPDYDVPQRTEYESGGGGDAAFASHKHDLIIKPWMPKINETVLCIYLPVFNSDGFVLGKVGT